jgi:hypothetical protein
MAQRDNRHFVWVLDMHHPAAGATGRCLVQPSTPMGPDQVNVLLLSLLYCLLFGNHVGAASNRRIANWLCSRTPNVLHHLPGQSVALDERIAAFQQICCHVLPGLQISRC